jgi:hypothetical protein
VRTLSAAVRVFVLQTLTSPASNAGRHARERSPRSPWSLPRGMHPSKAVRIASAPERSRTIFIAAALRGINPVSSLYTLANDEPTVSSLYAFGMREFLLRGPNYLKFVSFGQSANPGDGAIHQMNSRKLLVRTLVQLEMLTSSVFLETQYPIFRRSLSYPSISSLQQGAPLRATLYAGSTLMRVPGYRPV